MTSWSLKREPHYFSISNNTSPHLFTYLSISSHLFSPSLTSPHLILFHFISFHLISFYLISFHLISSHLISFHSTQLFPGLSSDHWQIQRPSQPAVIHDKRSDLRNLLLFLQWNAEYSTRFTRCCTNCSGQHFEKSGYFCCPLLLHLWGDFPYA